MKLMGKLIIIIGILLLGSSLNGISANKQKKIKRKYPVINDRRKAILSQKFNCNGKQYTVNYITDDKVQLVDALSNLKFQLDQVISASGSRYSNGKIEIHIKGDEAVLNQDGKDISCNLTK
nr:MliC family protein [uncultured Leptotrichia sp.]